MFSQVTQIGGGKFESQRLIRPTLYEISYFKPESHHWLDSGSEENAVKVFWVLTTDGSRHPVDEFKRNIFHFLPRSPNKWFCYWGIKKRFVSISIYQHAHKRGKAVHQPDAWPNTKLNSKQTGSKKYGNKDSCEKTFWLLVCCINYFAMMLTAEFCYDFRFLPVVAAGTAARLRLVCPRGQESAAPRSWLLMRGSARVLLMSGYDRTTAAAGPRAQEVTKLLFQLREQPTVRPPPGVHEI